MPPPDVCTTLVSVSTALSHACVTLQVLALEADVQSKNKEMETIVERERAKLKNELAELEKVNRKRAPCLMQQLYLLHGSNSTNT